MKLLPGDMVSARFDGLDLFGEHSVGIVLFQQNDELLIFTEGYVGWISTHYVVKVSP